MQSFSEIDTTSKRASKAAGFTWGIAEEVGKNMRNLEMFGLPGVKNLNLYLQKIKQNPSEKPKKIEKENKPASKEFCPIYCGTTFLDNCIMLESMKLVKFFDVSYPLLFLPFLLFCYFVTDLLKTDYQCSVYFPRLFLFAMWNPAVFPLCFLKEMSKFQKNPASGGFPFVFP